MTGGVLSPQHSFAQIVPSNSTKEIVFPCGLSSLRCDERNLFLTVYFTRIVRIKNHCAAPSAARICTLLILSCLAIDFSAEFPWATHSPYANSDPGRGDLLGSLGFIVFLHSPTPRRKLSTSKCRFSDWLCYQPVYRELLRHFLVDFNKRKVYQSVLWHQIGKKCQNLDFLRRFKEKFCFNNWGDFDPNLELLESYVTAAR